MNRGSAAKLTPVLLMCTTTRSSRASSGRRWGGRFSVAPPCRLAEVSRNGSDAAPEGSLARRGLATMLSASSADFRCASAIDSQHPRETEHRTLACSGGIRRLAGLRFRRYTGAARLRLVRDSHACRIHGAAAESRACGTGSGDLGTLSSRSHAASDRKSVV